MSKEAGLAVVGIAGAAVCMPLVIAGGVLALGGRLPGWWPLTADGQRLLAVNGEQMHEDELDAIVHALSELYLLG